MNTLSSDLINILQYLLPGFLTAWIFYGLTSYKKPSPFERVIQALIFTFVIQITLYGLSTVLFLILGLQIPIEIGTNENAVWSFLFAILLGLLFSYSVKRGCFHNLLTRAKIAKENSYSPVWFSAFVDREKYTVLHLDDGRRVYGWPSEWPTQPNSGHFLLQQAVWLSGEEQHETTRVESILIDAKYVKFVEFMHPIQESHND